MHRNLVRALAACGVFALAACSSASSSGTSTTSGSSAAAPSASKTLQVVAAEDFWGSIAQQIGGSRVQVRSIIDNPNADPHDYEPTAADGRAVATADVLIDNGIGYDTWAGKLAAANPAPQRVDVTVGDVVGAKEGDNPHRWYDPDAVTKVATAISQAFAKADPADAAAYTTGLQQFQTQATADYKKTIADIKSKYAGTPVGASESIFAMVAPALGLDLVTPPSFLKAISEGTDPTAADKTLIDQQITGKKIKVYVYNSQNATPDVQRQVEEAKAAGIPVTTITETMVPAGSTWQAWQTRQLKELSDALAKATGR